MERLLMPAQRPRQDLRQRTKSFALRIIRLTSALPTSLTARVIGNQVMKSGTSVGAHYREAFRSRSTAEFISKIEGGLQELDETSYWLALLAESKIFPVKRLTELQKETNELIVIFTICVRNAKGRKR
jgi:four helix bundle protein